jgi:hypothetical protein
VTGSYLRVVLEDKASDVDASSSDFWIMVAALKVHLDCSFPELITDIRITYYFSVYSFIYFQNFRLCSDTAYAASVVLFCVFTIYVEIVIYRVILGSCSCSFEPFEFFFRVCLYLL